MPLTSATVDAFGIVTLALIVLICCVGVFCVVYVLTFRSKINRRGRFYALRDFNSPWRVRIILVTFAVLWGLTELIRLPLLRRKGWLFHSLRFQWQANLCRLYALFSLGFAEPCFFLTALFLVRGSLREAPFTPRRRWNSKVIAFVLGFCLPVFVLQLLFVVISPALKFHKGYKEDREGYGKIPPYFTRTFLELEANNRRVAACAYPLFSSLVLALFAVSFLIYFLYLGWKMMLVVINRKLQVRVYSLVLVVVLLLPVHVIFLALSVLSTPGEAVFEAMAFLGFVTVLVCTTVGAWILVIRPITDALAVPWVSDTMVSRQQSWGALPTENIGIHLSEYATDQVQNARSLSGPLYHDEVANSHKETKIPGKHFGLSLSIKERDLDEASTSSLSLFAHADGRYHSPSLSPILAGKPLLLDHQCI